MALWRVGLLEPRTTGARGGLAAGAAGALFEDDGFLLTATTVGGRGGGALKSTLSGERSRVRSRVARFESLAPTSRCAPRPTRPCGRGGMSSSSVAAKRHLRGVGAASSSSALNAGSRGGSGACMGAGFFVALGR